MKRAISIFFASIILLSSTGFAFTTHYCMGHAVDSAITLGEGDLSCGMTDMEAACETDAGEMAFMPQSCCDNDHISIQIKDDYQADLEAISMEKQFLFAFTYAFLNPNYSSEEQPAVVANTNSPPLETDFQSRYQTFLL